MGLEPHEKILYVYRRIFPPSPSKEKKSIFCIYFLLMKHITQTLMNHSACIHKSIIKPCQKTMRHLFVEECFPSTLHASNKVNCGWRFVHQNFNTAVAKCMHLLQRPNWARGRQFIEEARGADTIIALSPHSLMSHFLIKNRHPVPATATKTRRSLWSSTGNKILKWQIFWWILPPSSFLQDYFPPLLIILAIRLVGFNSRKTLQNKAAIELGYFN